MDKAAPNSVRYKRSHFSTQLPVDYLYSPSHYWLAQVGENHWRVGFTRFATRMLGEIVDFGFEIEPGMTIEPGQVLGWIEGFKAISDLFCPVAGEFHHANLPLRENLSAISKDGYRSGWLFEARGQPDQRCVDVHAYQRILDKTIDRILEKQSGTEIG